MTKIKLIEQETVERAYGILGTNAILEHNKYGRMLAMDAFGGIDTLAGGTVRWMHGMAIKLRNNDTLESINNMHPDLRTSMLLAYDKQRPVLTLRGQELEAIAKRVGL